LIALLASLALVASAGWHAVADDTDGVGLEEEEVFRAAAAAVAALAAASRASLTTETSWLTCGAPQAVSGGSGGCVSGGCGKRAPRRATPLALPGHGA
jgi:hypothetical protein